MNYPKTGSEVYVSLNLSNTMLTGIGKLSEEHRRLVVIEVTGLRRKNGSLLPEYTEEEFNEATFAFVKYYVQGTHYDTLVEENKKLKFELEQELEWRNRTDN